MKRLFLICLLVSLTAISGANYTHATEPEKGEASEDSTEKTVVTFSEPDENTETAPNENAEPVTIQQMKDNLEDLKTEKEEVGNKWVELAQVNWRILDFLKEDLNNQDVQTIRQLSLDFQQKQTFYEQQLKDNAEENFNTAVDADNDTAAVKHNFIQYKLNFYKALVPYVNTALKNEYLEYIRSNIAIEHEEKTIKEKIYKQEEVIEERVETIKERIKEHNQELEEKIEKLVRESTRGKINAILARPQFTNISNERKVSILKVVWQKLTENKQSFIQNSTDSEYNLKKRAIFEIVVEEVYNKIEELKQ